MGRIILKRNPIEKINSKWALCRRTLSEIKQAYDIGYRRFKIQGRKLIWEAPRYDIIWYLFEREEVVPLLIHIVDFSLHYSDKPLPFTIKSKDAL